MYYRKYRKPTHTNLKDQRCIIEITILSPCFRRWRTTRVVFTKHVYTGTTMSLTRTTTPLTPARRSVLNLDTRTQAYQTRNVSVLVRRCRECNATDNRKCGIACPGDLSYVCVVALIRCPYILYTTAHVSVA